MSWSIPTKIEEDFISGRAQYRTFQTGSGGQSILPVPTNAYIVIFGYDFSPAGGGIHILGQAVGALDFFRNYTNSYIKAFETQQISFYTGNDFYPFIHHVNTQISMAVKTVDATIPDQNQVTEYQVGTSIDNTPIARQVYITSSNDVTITHGLILDDLVATFNSIPVTNRTPNLLTYGGSGIVNATQTDFGPAATPIQFMQPSPKDYQEFGFGLLPNGASGQAFATPDATRGLYPSGTFLNDIGYPSAAGDYFLNLHYALYTSTIPEQRG
jgi:hypothetical protein